MLKFAANVSWMFTDFPTIAQRIVRAKENGFEAVEITMPYVDKKESIADALKETGIKCVLINSSSIEGYFGIAIDPSKKTEFKETLEVSIEYARALKCPRMHILAGCVNADSKFTMKEAEDTYVENIRYAVDRLAKENIIVLAEFINSVRTFPGYFLDSPEKVIEMIKRIDRGDKVQFQLDLFHLQVANGDLTHNMEKYLPQTGYIQVSQVPDRGDPFSPGEINYQYIFDYLKKSKYAGWIGLEYKPPGETEVSLQGMKERKYLH